MLILGDSTVIPISERCAFTPALMISAMTLV
jgi:hypothetical protein